MKKTIATLVDHDGNLLIKADSIVEIAILGFVVSQVLSTMGAQFGEDVAQAAAALRETLADDVQLPTTIISSKEPHPHG